jgi:hypothetical protein
MIYSTAKLWKLLALNFFFYAKQGPSSYSDMTASPFSSSHARTPSLAADGRKVIGQGFMNTKLRTAVIYSCRCYIFSLSSMQFVENPLNHGADYA